jgi:DNA-binding response OmpR family regulator
LATNEKTLVLQNDQETILVVDDEPRILSQVSAALVDGNYKVLTASSGSKGLEESREYKSEIHLLLADFAMPAMSGRGLGHTNDS